MICEKCGNELNKEDKYCSICGEKKGSNKWYIYCGVLVGLIGIISIVQMMIVMAKDNEMANQESQSQESTYYIDDRSDSEEEIVEEEEDVVNIEPPKQNIEKPKKQTTVEEYKSIATSKIKKIDENINTLSIVDSNYYMDNIECVLFSALDNEGCEGDRRFIMTKDSKDIYVMYSDGSIITEQEYIDYLSSHKEDDETDISEYIIGTWHHEDDDSKYIEITSDTIGQNPYEIESEDDNVCIIKVDSGEYTDKYRLSLHDGKMMIHFYNEETDSFTAGDGLYIKND